MVLEAQQCGRLELTGLWAFCEEDRVMREETRKLSRDHAHGIDCRVPTGRARGRNAHITVSLTAENYQVDHNCLQLSRIITRTMNLGWRGIACGTLSSATIPTIALRRVLRICANPNTRRSGMMSMPSCLRKR